MSERRYGDFEMVNGAQLNAANDRITKLEQQRNALLELIKPLIDIVENGLKDAPEITQLARKLISEIEATK